MRNNSIKFFSILFALFLFFGIGANCLYAQSAISDPDALAIPDQLNSLPPDVYYHGTVVKELGKDDFDYTKISEQVQQIRVHIDNGEKKGIEVGVANNIPTNEPQAVKIKTGDRVVIVESSDVDGRHYAAVDFYRMNALWGLLGVFVLLVLMTGRTKGAFSILGLLFSIAVLVWFVVPQIIAGRDPLVVSIIGSLAIVLVSLYLAHGFNKRTSVALLSTFITLALSGVCAVIAVSLSHLLGTGSEDAVYLQLGGNAINLKGLFLGGIIIGTLGVLDDVTTTQCAAVDELYNANASLTRHELYKRAFSIGREHISSVVNTLALAYAGAALPLMLLFTLSKGQPAWVIINDGNIAEEIVRTIVGSVSLILAVPISTFLAVCFLKKKGREQIRVVPLP